jgi:hypothetical protein
MSSPLTSLTFIFLIFLFHYIVVCCKVVDGAANIGKENEHLLPYLNNDFVVINQEGDVGIIKLFDESDILGVYNYFDPPKNISQDVNDVHSRANVDLVSRRRRI